jgi:predicted nucleotidyltransferase
MRLLILLLASELAATAGGLTRGPVVDRLPGLPPPAAAPLILPAPLASAAELAAAPEKLWTGGARAADANRLMRTAQWATTKFFFTSRVVLLRDMIEQQKKETAGLEKSVADLEAMWLDWRVKAYSGRVTTAGFEVADRATIRREALKLFDRHFPRDDASRGAFRSYLDRVDSHVPMNRPSQYRKLAFGIFYENATTPPEALVGRINSKLSPEHIDQTTAFRRDRQSSIFAAFQEAALLSQAEANRTLAPGKKIVAVIVLGSYAIDQATPQSDIDYQLVTQDGSPAAIPVFAAALDRLWTKNRLEKIEAFQFTLPPSREIVTRSFLEGYRVISVDPAAVSALSTDRLETVTPSGWTRLRGASFGAFYRAWCWSYMRWSSLRR